VGKEIEDMKVVVLGTGAAGVSCTKIMLGAGVKSIVACDRGGTIHKGRTENMNPAKEWLADNTNQEGVKGSIVEASDGADLFLGLSGPNTFPEEALQRMAADPIVFALANPTPEIAPDVASKRARIIATGRSDFPNQINNVLCFPGLFKGALSVRSRSINEEMKLAAAKAIADIIQPGELSEEYVIPSVFNRDVADSVSDAVAQAAVDTGVARRRRPMKDSESKE